MIKPIDIYSIMPHITQAHVSPHIAFFEEKFMSRWNFRQYDNSNEPAVFFGISASAELIQNHKGLKIIIPAGPGDFINWDYITNRENLFILSGIDNYKELSLCFFGKVQKVPSEVKVEHLLIETKDYSLFKPNVFGDKIYYYSVAGGWSPSAANWPVPISEIQKHIDYEIVTAYSNGVHEYLSIGDLKKNYYDKTFLCLNMTDDAGMTTTRELGLMGRKTLMNTTLYKKNYKKSMLGYNDIGDIIRIINEEAKKIGTIQPSIDSHTMITNEWLTLDFWDRVAKKQNNNE